MAEEVIDDWLNALGKPVTDEGKQAALDLLVGHGYNLSAAAMVLSVVAREVEHDQPERAQRYMRSFVGDRNLTLMYQVFAVMLARGSVPEPKDEEPITATFEPEEAAKIKYLIRHELRKMARGRPKMAVKFGAEADFTSFDRKRAALEACYRKLGGDPDNITNRGNDD